MGEIEQAGGLVMISTWLQQVHYAYACMHAYSFRVSTCGEAHPRRWYYMQHLYLYFIYSNLELEFGSFAMHATAFFFKRALTIADWHHPGGGGSLGGPLWGSQGHFSGHVERSKQSRVCPSRYRTEGWILLNLRVGVCPICLAASSRLCLETSSPHLAGQLQ